MKTLTGYSDQISVLPTQRVRFFVSSENGAPYNVRMLRLIHGDTNPQGPGFKAQTVPFCGKKTYPGQRQTDRKSVV